MPTSDSIQTGVPNRAAAVQAEILWSWNAYKKDAWGSDELKPVSRRGGRSALLGGASGTMVDSIDTLVLAGFRDESSRVARWLKQHPPTEHTKGQVSVFETSIRVLGGLLGAYTTHGEPIFLRRAEELGRALLPAFRRGVFRPAIDLRTGQVSPTRRYTVAELGSLQLEFYELARLTKNRDFFDAACKTHQWLLRRALRADPPYLMGGTITSTHMSTERHMGGGVDSYYEYLLKVWHQGGRRQDELRDFYQKTSDALHQHLIRVHDGHTFVSGTAAHKKSIDHLTCFAPGMFALGSALMPGWRHAARDMTTAKGLMSTCFRLYQTPRHASCEEARYVEGKGGGGGFRVTNPVNILRPEVAESLFVLFRTTRDTRYREMGWVIFERFRNSSRVPSGGYAGLQNVQARRPRRIDTMETFWVAETLKYLYLLQAPLGAFDLERSVLSTEAHVLNVTSAMPLCKVPSRAASPYAK